MSYNIFKLMQDLEILKNYEFGNLNFSNHIKFMVSERCSLI